MSAETWLVGRRGQGLAAALLCVVLAVVWLGAIDPLRSWFDDRDALLGRRQALLQRMRDVATTLPSLRAAAEKAPTQGNIGGTSMLPGSTDAVAAADLQEQVQRMAANAGVSLTAVETLPSTPTGNWHRVSLRISLNAPWPVLMALLRAIEDSPTHVLVDDIHFHSTSVVNRPTVLPVQASMVLYGFRPTEAGTGA